MNRKIVIYGNPDKTELGFPMPGDIKRYIENDIIAEEHGRYRYTQQKNADVIVLSREGLAYGHFDITGKIKPNDEDRLKYPRVKCVYLVGKRTLYRDPVLLSKLGISNIRWGLSVSEMKFRRIQKLAGQTREFKDFQAREEVQSGNYIEKTVESIFEGPSTSPGIAFQPDVYVRKAVEERALLLAEESYQSQGHVTRRVGKPYDLYCEQRSRRDKRHVEVKGFQEKNPMAVILTAGEVEHARKGTVAVDLVIVSAITVEGISNKIKGKGGHIVRHVKGWKPLEKHLQPTQYSYTIPS